MVAIASVCVACARSEKQAVSVANEASVSRCAAKDDGMECRLVDWIVWLGSG